LVGEICGSISVRKEHFSQNTRPHTLQWCLCEEDEDELVRQHDDDDDVVKKRTDPQHEGESLVALVAGAEIRVVGPLHQLSRSYDGRDLFICE
jgi:hypothetical protein